MACGTMQLRFFKLGTMLTYAFKNDTASEKIGPRIKTSDKLDELGVNLIGKEYSIQYSKINGIQ